MVNVFHRFVNRLSANNSLLHVADELVSKLQCVAHETRSHLNLVPDEYRYNDAINQIDGAEKPIPE